VQVEPIETAVDEEVARFVPDIPRSPDPWDAALASSPDMTYPKPLCGIGRIRRLRRSVPSGRVEPAPSTGRTHGDARDMPGRQKYPLRAHGALATSSEELSVGTCLGSLCLRSDAAPAGASWLKHPERFGPRWARNHPGWPSALVCLRQVLLCWFWRSTSQSAVSGKIGRV
jgi:hypothetical protein